MTRVTWDDSGHRRFHTGIDRGMIYLDDGTVSAWNGLVAVTEAPSGGDPVATYIDGEKVLNVAGEDNYTATIESFTFPVRAAMFAGWGILQYGLLADNQPKMSFGFSYRTLIGNDVSGPALGYRVHVIFGCKTQASDFAHQTVTDQPSARTYSFGITAVPVSFAGLRPTAHVIFDTRTKSPSVIAAIEAILYGDNTHDPVMPTTSQISAMLALGDL